LLREGTFACGFLPFRFLPPVYGLFALFLFRFWVEFEWFLDEIWDFLIVWKTYTVKLVNSTEDMLHKVFWNYYLFNLFTIVDRSILLMN
jgi:hypothetical protein